MKDARSFVALSAVAVALAVVIVASGAFAPATAGTLPANRTVAAGSGISYLTAPLTEGYSSENVTVLTSHVRLSNPTDLILRVTAECALWTDVATVGNDASESVASVKLWVEIDGAPVPVADEEEGEVGQVVFCNRTYARETSGFENENATIATYLKTRTANAFNWFTTDVPGSAGVVHTIEVKARLEAQVTNLGTAQAGIGKRTLIVEPVKLGDDVYA